MNGPRDGAPLASIVILTQDHVELLRACLTSIERSTDAQRVPYETIVLFNGTPRDEVQAFLDKPPAAVRGLHVRLNLGFGRGNNYAAREARGSYLVFLNDDAVAHDGWLDALVARAQAHAGTGIVGSRILFPDGTLQEAGAIVWSDASAYPLGRGEPAGSLAYSYARCVDYTSANGMLIEREAFDALGGFDEDFSPAYYEDMDLCLRVRHELGREVFYEPRSVISHIEAASAASADFRSFLFRRNQAKLQAKHRDVLRGYPAPDPSSPVAVEQAVLRRLGNPRRVLVIDDRLPDAGLGSGFGRGLDLLDSLRPPSYAIAFHPSDKGSPVTENSASDLGVDVVTEELEQHLRRPEKAYDAVVISRPHNFERFFQTVRSLQPNAAIVFDAEALYHRRLQIQVRLENDDARRAELQAQAQVMERLECAIALGADRLVCVSEDERAWLERIEGHAPIEFMRPLTPGIAMTPRNPHERRDALFAAGWLGGDASPNVDALEWYAADVVPRVRREVPGFRTLVTGRRPPPRAQALANDAIVFTGYLPSLAEAYAAARVAVAPIRIGAGIKIKTMEAFQYGVPVVATSVGAEGLCLIDDSDIDVADDPATFAQRLVALLTGDDLWQRRRGAIERTVAAWETQRVLWRDVMARTLARSPVLREARSEVQ